MKKIIGLILGLASLFAFLATPVFAECPEICSSVANPPAELCPSECNQGEDDAMAKIKSILNTVYLWVGIITVIVIIIGGVYYITSQGDPGKVAKAKNVILYAVIGLVVVLLAFAITDFVLGSL